MNIEVPKKSKQINYVFVFICWRVAPLSVCAINSNLKSVVHAGKVFLHLFNFSTKLLCDTFDVNKLNSEEIKSNIELSYTIQRNNNSYLNFGKEYFSFFHL